MSGEKKLQLSAITDYLKSTKLKPYFSAKKLISDHSNKKKIFIHYTRLNFLISQGMEITKVNRIVRFKHKAWLKPYVPKNIEKKNSNK